MTRILYQDPSAGLPDAPSNDQVRTFHRAIEGYAATPLLSLPTMASALGVGALDVKIEADRYGLPSFKVMGASWATIVALGAHLPSSWRPGDGLTALAGSLPPLTLIAATDGNHGRALAWVARQLGLRSRIFVPQSTTPARLRPIAAEGAELVLVPGTYDDAVARSAREADQDGFLLVSDTSWPGYEEIPNAVIDGYGTILLELEEQLRNANRYPPHLVLVPMGVGAFAAAVIRHLRRKGQAWPHIIGVEPTRAACVMASLAAGRRIDVPGPHDSIMAGLNCGTPSFIAWPTLRDGLDGSVAIEDAAALDGVRMLGAAGIAVGECSGAVVAAAIELLAGPAASVHRARLALPPDPSVLLLATEGVTDEEAFTRTMAGVTVAGGDRVKVP